MKTKLFFSVLCVCMSCTFASAQISTGESTAHVIKTGNRPEAGDFGIFIGPSFSEIMDMIDSKIKVRGVPLVNFKYYSTSQLEWRLGLQFYKTSEKLKGDLMEDAGSVTNKKMESYNRITPGVAYHFSSRNILDVYVGASLPFGWDRNRQIGESKYNGVKELNNVTRGSFVIGAGGFIGLQAFVADLPFSIGLEYGFSGLLHTGLKNKHEVQSGDEKQTYYTPSDKDMIKDFGDEGSRYDKLHAKKGEFGSDVRITFSYYFKKK